MRCPQRLPLGSKFYQYVGFFALLLSNITYAMDDEEQDIKEPFSQLLVLGSHQITNFFSEPLDRFGKPDEEHHKNFRHRFFRFMEKEKIYVVMPLVNKKLRRIFIRECQQAFAHTHISPRILMAFRPKDNSSDNLKSEEHTHIQQNALAKKQPKADDAYIIMGDNAEPVPGSFDTQKLRILESTFFWLPYGISLFSLFLNLLHEPLFKSYFAQGSMAYFETVVIAVAVIFSLSACITTQGNTYTCCNKSFHKTKCGRCYGMIFQLILGTGNLLNLGFSCLTKQCSLGAYLPLTASTAVISSLLLFCGGFEICCPKPHKKKPVLEDKTPD